MEVTTGRQNSAIICIHQGIALQGGKNIVDSDDEEKRS
jgi:hypothetical protein